MNYAIINPLDYIGFSNKAFNKLLRRRKVPNGTLRCISA